MKLLLVEDDLLLGEGIVTALENQRYRVEWARNAGEAESLCRAAEFDLLVLDLGLPDMDGMLLLKRLRNQGVKSPVLILTARDGIEERVRGLDAGADDFVCKPFDLEELLARLRALGRRGAGIASPVIKLGNIEICPKSFSVRQAGESVSLSRYEFDLLLHLASYPMRVFSRDMLVDQLYSWDKEIGSNTVEVYVHHLRKKLGKTVIRTVRGVGYQLGEAAA